MNLGHKYHFSINHFLHLLSIRSIFLVLIFELVSACSSGDSQPASTTPSPSATLSASPLTFLTTGYNHSCAITASGVLKCWGANTSGQIGNNSLNDAYTPSAVTQASAEDTYSSVSAGYYYSCGVTTSGTLKCWGENNLGQLGTGNTTPSTTPTPIDEGTSYLTVSAGLQHACGITALTHQVKCWGVNSYGEVGNGATSGVSTPTLIDSSNTYQFISAGAFHTCGITTSGVLKCWGHNSSGQIGNGVANSTDILTPTPISENSTYIAVSAGGSHTCGITSSGALQCWGANASGQIGNGVANSTNILTPTPPSGTDSYTSVSAGNSHTCGITTTGVLKCWGDNSAGQIGTGSTTSPHILNPTSVSTTTSYLAVSAGNEHTCGLVSDHIINCWGSNSWGQLGTFDQLKTLASVPTPITSGETYTDISAGFYHACGITSTGILKCWGLNESGQLGNGGFETAYTPTAVSDTSHYTQVSAGLDYTCGITTSGALKCWGKNEYGQLGLEPSPTPSMTAIPSQVGLTAYTTVSTGFTSTCARNTTGQILCWGGNNAGEIGNGNSTPQYTPTLIDGGTLYSSIAKGYDHTCGILTNGNTLKCWGGNSKGELGIGSQDGKSSPTANSDSSSYSAISAGTYQTCGITSSGALKCWGNLMGPSPSPSYTSTPTSLDSSTQYQSVSVSGTFSCAITTAGILKCWGKNENHELGIPSTGETEPKPVDSGVIYTKVTLGGYYACGITTYGTLKCWGTSDYGTLGAGFEDSSIPHPIFDSYTLYKSNLSLRIERELQIDFSLDRIFNLSPHLFNSDFINPKKWSLTQQTNSSFFSQL